MSKFNSDPFGGKWSGAKLKALRSYLESYTTALKKQNFDLVYIDAFAGAGAREVIGCEEETLFTDQFEEVSEYRHGSPLIALSTRPPFDRFVFVDKDPASIGRLQNQVEQMSVGDGRRVEYRCGDANAILQELTNENWRSQRAVAFLDPFALHVSWETIERIGKTQSIDMWLLFPAMAVNRMLPRSGKVPELWASKLDETFGAEDWRGCFFKRDEDLFGDEVFSKTPKIFSELSDYITMRLGSVFSGVHKNPLILRNSTGAPLFLLCFASGSPKGWPIAVRIAQHIIDKQSHGH